MKTGDILISRWGYEQTNVDFYEVVKATLSTVSIRPLNTIHVEENMSGKIAPLKGSYSGEAMRRKIHRYNGDEMVKIESYSFARPWSGKPANFTTYA